MKPKELTLEEQINENKEWMNSCIKIISNYINNNDFAEANKYIEILSKLCNESINLCNKEME